MGAWHWRRKISPFADQKGDIEFKFGTLADVSCITYIRFCENCGILNFESSLKYTTIFKT